MGVVHASSALEMKISQRMLPLSGVKLSMQVAWCFCASARWRVNEYPPLVSFFVVVSPVTRQPPRLVRPVTCSRELPTMRPCSSSHRLKSVVATRYFGCPIGSAVSPSNTVESQVLSPLQISSAQPLAVEKANASPVAAINRGMHNCFMGEALFICGQFPFYRLPLPRIGSADAPCDKLAVSVRPLGGTASPNV